MLHSAALPCTPHLYCEVGKAKGVLIPHSNVAAGLVGHMHLRGQQQKAAAKGSSGRQQRKAAAAAAARETVRNCLGNGRGSRRRQQPHGKVQGQASAELGSQSGLRSVRQRLWQGQQAEPTTSACLVALFDEPNEGATHGDDVVIGMRG
jgi:hypothetical protein